jgi:hypothetical protein
MTEQTAAATPRHRLAEGASESSFAIWIGTNAAAQPGSGEPVELQEIRPYARSDAPYYGCPAAAEPRGRSGAT